MSALQDFLLRKTITPGGVLPVVHTTVCHHLKKFCGTDKIQTTQCDVFKSDKLSYFFVGRPAYKFQSDGSEAEDWELPCCFVFEFAALTDIKRIFPFDSGAFANERYPGYINKLAIEEFETCSAPDAVSRIIGAFFGDARSYFDLSSKDRSIFENEFSLGAFDAEIKALHRLSRAGAPATFDDRRFTIELQSTSDIDLTLTNPIAVIAPLSYFDHKAFMQQVQTTWNAIPLGYKTFRLSTQAYYSQIYSMVDKLFQENGLYQP